MAIWRYHSSLLLFSLLLIMIPHTTQLQSSQAWSLLRIQRLLNYPSALSGWNNYRDFCYADPSPSATVVCYEENITQLHISGGEGTPPLPRSFSIESFFTTLTRLPNLKVLCLTSLGLWGALPAKISRLPSLEIVNMSSNFLFGAIPQEVSNLKGLQTLILDYNMFSGQVPDWLSELRMLVVLSLRNNSMTGVLPISITELVNLRVLVLASNSLDGALPNLSSLANLQVLDLGGNYFGHQFPSLGKKVVNLVLRKNRLTGGLPPEVTSFYQLQHLDISLNRFVGPFPPLLLSLPSIRYLNIAGNRFTGMLFQNMSCSEDLEFADLSSNLLMGSLPTCLTLKSNERFVHYSNNCLGNKDQSQHPSLFCQNQALAVGIVPHKKNKVSVGKAVLLMTLVLGVAGGAVLVGFLLFFGIRRANIKRTMKIPPRRLVEHASSGYPSKLLADARYISQTMRLTALGVPLYRSFSLEEIEAATNNFESASFMGEGSHGQMYRGKLNDGSLVAIKYLKLKKSHSSQNFNRHIELISKLRHRHLVSALGHCFDDYLEDSTVSRLFLIFECVSNGTLRSNLLDGTAGHKLTWTQRIAAATGVARGIQFLHAGIIPGLFANDLKTTNILLDQNLVAKISSYSLPALLENMKNEIQGGSSSSGPKEPTEMTKDGDKIDIYDLGIILLEIISGRPIASQSEVNFVKNQLQTSMAADGPAKRKNIVDPVVCRTCCEESLKTVVEICIQCLSSEPTGRPSVEDVIWNLQFAAQVQDSWRGGSHSSEGSQPSPSYDSPVAAEPPSRCRTSISSNLN